jgi:hypothetical protein
MRALAIEGYIIGLFVMVNGLYVISFPPYGDEPQGYAIIAIGTFIILATQHQVTMLEKSEDRTLPPS